MTKFNFPSQKEAKQRIVINNVNPEIDCGEYYVKRCVNDKLVVSANIFSDGHDEIKAYLSYRHESDELWQRSDFYFLNNDRWETTISLPKMGFYYLIIKAFIDELGTWKRNVIKKINNNVLRSIDIQLGVELIKAQALRSDNDTKKQLEQFTEQLPLYERNENLIEILASSEFDNLITKHFQPEIITEYPKILKIFVDREKAVFSAWYEIFPRSLNSSHGTFNDLINHLPYIKNMGFDTIYLPPIHPIGKTNRKGKNNSLKAEDHHPGSPWAIGNQDGGHTSIHPQLGTLADFKKLVKIANENSIEIALDLALQCSPDHSYLRDHPDWFKINPDGSLQYAENPPKKYEDIYPFNFASRHWKSLWKEIKKIVKFWVQQGIYIFRVDNPHTKPFVFWEWLINEIKKEYPQVIFLAEAFTRPNPMYQLAKLGFSQSYTYFTWKNTKQELSDYINELISYPIKEFFRPNFWPNTPDILHDFLQKGGKPAFLVRITLAAMLSSNYGIYGPTYELCENVPLHHGSEEYLDSEKYEIKSWALNKDNISSYIQKINSIRKENTALHRMDNLQLHYIDNDQIFVFSKHTNDFSNVILIIVNLDIANPQSGMLEIPGYLHFNQEKFQIKDLLTDVNYTWQRGKNYVALNPTQQTAHIFQIIRDDNEKQQ